MLRLVWVFLLMCFSIQAHTVEEKLYKQHADYKIFYSAFNTSCITPDIAAAIGGKIIQRMNIISYSSIYYDVSF